MKNQKQEESLQGSQFAKYSWRKLHSHIFTFSSPAMKYPFSGTQQKLNKWHRRYSEFTETYEVMKIKS